MSDLYPLGLDVYEWLDLYRHDLTDAELQEVIEIAVRNEQFTQFEPIPVEELREHTGQYGFGARGFADPFVEPQIPSDVTDFDMRDYYTHQGTIVNYAGIPINEWIKPFANPYGSTWIGRMQFQPYETPGDYGDLFVEFISLAMVCYRYCPLGDWIDAVLAPSKGQWVYWDCKDTGRPYILMRSGQRENSTIYQYVKPILDFRKRKGGSFNTRPMIRRTV